ncbi:hypothetical protein AZE42_06225 [Rhizopogon vesiculosus]|uniref:Uncharacterized protein n=1 Tax=Rhizopogon vesiculosus TaxID=180088 RepID=A0A1J8QHT1_9AGAM|nr:hypothetical protein AZE42_06225 [Rhizopogon vesiculosus]
MSAFHSSSSRLDHNPRVLHEYRS